MKILDTRWFNRVGIVRVSDPYDGIKYYIKEIDGLNKEDEDARLIADWGSTFPNDAGDVLFGVTR
jgi:hypothetical protein